MTDEPSRHPTGPLTDTQIARIDYARRDLTYARTEDLAQLDAAGLILLVEKLRGRLGDLLGVVDEMCGSAPEESDSQNKPYHHP